MTFWRRLPPDAVAFVAIALALVVTHVPLITHGMCFNDPSWLFHFGRKSLHGAVPYRDYVFDNGPLPIFVDASFQQVFGERYVASLFAALFVKVLRVWVVWMIVRRLASVPAACALAVFVAFDPWFAFAHHGSLAYVELAITVAALCAITGSRADGRRTLVYFAATGFSAAMVFAARPTSGLLVALVLGVGSTVLFVRRETLDLRRYLALWAGFAAALLVLVTVLAVLGALGPAIQQLFLDESGKRVMRGGSAMMDSLSGGALVDHQFTSKLRGFLFFLGLPLVVSIGVTVLARRAGSIASSTLGLLAVPTIILVGLLTRDLSLELATDLPRTFLSCVAALALISPARTRQWLGLEPLVAFALAGLALASEWALEMLFPGRGWGDIGALVTAVILLALASTHLTVRAKTFLCGALAIAGLAHLGAQLRNDLNPLTKLEASDGLLAETSVEPALSDPRTAVLRGLELPEWRVRAVEWLATTVPARSTCFIYAHLPGLYDVLDCTNPTQLDSTLAVFPSVRDARAAAAALQANPPEYILAHERTWMSPPISLDLGGKLDRYDGWNPKVSLALHTGLRGIIEQYESIGTVGEALGPTLAPQAAHHWDALDAVRVYRRRR